MSFNSLNAGYLGFKQRYPARAGAVTGLAAELAPGFQLELAWLRLAGHLYENGAISDFPAGHVDAIRPDGDFERFVSEEGLVVDGRDAFVGHVRDDPQLEFGVIHRLR